MSKNILTTLSKIVLILSSVFILLYYKNNVIRIWTPEKLSYTLTERIIDPEDYLSWETKQSITDKIRKMQKDTQYNLRVYIISEISEDFIEIQNDKKKKNVTLFLDELASIIFKERNEVEENSILILFSVNDFKMRIRTGYNVKSKLSDRKCGLFLKSVKNTFRQKNYEKVIFTVLEKINARLVSSFFANLQEDIYELISSILSFIVMFSIVISILTILVKMLAKEEITEDIGKVKKIIINESECFICRKEIRKSKFDEEFAGLKIFKATLYCDHSFHFNCIAEVMEKNEKCPLCEHSKEVTIVENKTQYRSKSLFERIPLKLNLRTNSFSD